MTRTRITTALAAVGLTALSLTAIPSAAQASESAPSPTRAAAAPDGYLYAWENENRDGRHCRWSGGDDNWATCSPQGPMRNTASAVENRGYTHDVWLYYSPGPSGARFCLNRGVYLENIVHHYFPHNGAGGGESLNDNIAAHAWTPNC
ncbi:peptidase inhibitor family I36 protein [Streptomyces phaeochromogenes]|uniref:peptidase inhibitor family I36 protein n=1 Tax=Streptomyces phaeochromogenes TaxID=1923 RepID=UPI002DD7AC26|nr:peptidase inhibitor family I36 protein [Streptomyces phaeochromogenes]WRZ26280.1 peptidase inhibitor family I36 protein [Streptomyces phaeochromogenes]